MNVLRDFMAQRLVPHTGVQNAPTMQHAMAVMAQRLIVMKNIINLAPNVWNARTIIVCAVAL